MSGKKDNLPDGLNRRAVLQSVGLIGLTSTGAINTVAANSDQSSQLEEKVIGIAELQSTVGAIRGDGEIATIEKELRDRGYRPQVNNIVGIPVPTEKVRTIIPDDFPEFDHAAFEEMDPVTVFLPYVNNSDDVALVISLVATKPRSNRRAKRPVAAMGLVESGNEPSGSDGVAALTSNGAVDVIGFDDPLTEQDSGPREAKVIDTWGGDDVNPQYTGFGCLALVLELCRRWGTGATVTQCGNVCLRTAQPWFIAGCGSFCVGLVLVIQRYGCESSGAVICAAATAG